MEQVGTSRTGGDISVRKPIIDAGERTVLNRTVIVYYYTPKSGSMGSDTTIPVSHETKEQLSEGKQDGETWDAYLRRLGTNESPDAEVPPGIERIMEIDEQTRRIEDILADLPERTADELETRLR